jgi:hypothetical protein
MPFGNAHAVAHDIDHFGNVPAEIVIIRSETVAQTTFKIIFLSLLPGLRPRVPVQSCRMNRHRNNKIKYMKKTETKNATAQLADLNAQIEALKQQKTSLAEPMKARHAELRSELLQVETEIRELDSSWKPASLRPKAEDKITEILAKGPMTIEEISQAVNGAFSAWKLKSVLKSHRRFPMCSAQCDDGNRRQRQRRPGSRNAAAIQSQEHRNKISGRVRGPRL